MRIIILLLLLLKHGRIYSWERFSCLRLLIIMNIIILNASWTVFLRSCRFKIVALSLGICIEWGLKFDTDFVILWLGSNAPTACQLVGRAHIFHSSPLTVPQFKSLSSRAQGRSDSHTTFAITASLSVRFDWVEAHISVIVSDHACPFHEEFDR